MAEIKIDEGRTKMRIDNHPDKVDVSKVGKKIKRNPWAIVSLILFAIIVVYFVLSFTGKLPTGFSVFPTALSADKAGAKVVEYLNTRTGGGVEFVSASDSGSLYQVMVSYQGQEIPVFTTKDGKYFVQGAIPMDDTSGVAATTACKADTDCPEGAICSNGKCVQKPQEITKSDKPTVELFVMTECPYGTQAEKGLIPALETLGNKIDANIRFVHYFMHGDKEEQETYRQVCIREEQSDKYLNYLKCYLTDGDSARCIKEVKISQSKLDSCVKDKSKTYYASDSELSNGYGVQGSPTLVINGEIASSGRDSASYLSAICSAFNSAPAECEKELSSSAPSPGFGYSASEGAASAASCG